MAKITYIGFDLGDGETITDFVTIESGKTTTKTLFDNMTMPDSVNPGQAMPSVFAFDDTGDVIFSQTISADPEAVKSIITNFKRRPGDLIGDFEFPYDEETVRIKSFSNWPDISVWPEGNTQEMLTFRDNVTAFTNAIFTNSNYLNRLKTATQNSDEIVFCVGYPTNWSALDIAIYELILKNTVIGTGEYAGKKASLIMEAESRAAFLYAKDIEAFGTLSKGSSALLIDVGSSTIDITAMTALSNNHQYNSGSNYLGARSIDFIIRELYLSKIRKQPALWAMYEDLVKENPTISYALALSCRRAKEQIFSSTNGMAVINFALFPGIRLTADELNQIIDKTPISDILKQTINLNEREQALMGNKTWKELFKEFLIEQKALMAEHGIIIECIILTGSASKMPFVPEIVSEVFYEIPEEALKYDMDPSRTISKGLALVGPSNDKSKNFQKDLNILVDKKLKHIVNAAIPALARELGKVVAGIVTPRMKKRIADWKDGKIKTLNEMNEYIKRDCSEENLTRILSNNPHYQKAIENWLKYKVGKDIALELKELCDKYDIQDISVEDLNIMTMPVLNIGTIPLDPLEFTKTISTIVAVISGVISAASIGTIMGVVVLVVSFISQSLAVTLFAALSAMGPVGWGILAAVVGVAVTVLVAGGFNKFKDLFKDKVMDWNLPQVARKTMTDERINKSFAEANLPKQIYESFRDPKLREQIIEKVAANLKNQIELRAEDIKYAIESK